MALQDLAHMDMYNKHQHQMSSIEYLTITWNIEIQEYRSLGNCHKHAWYHALSHEA